MVKSQMTLFVKLLVFMTCCGFKPCRRNTAATNCGNTQVIGDGAVNCPAGSCFRIWELSILPLLPFGNWMFSWTGSHVAALDIASLHIRS